MSSLEHLLEDVDTGDTVVLEELVHHYSDHPVLHPNHYLVSNRSMIMCGRSESRRLNCLQVVELEHSLVFAYASLRPHLSRWWR